ncbi:PREDICTED: uncharacterized protein LOC105458834 [Wasmannia auropunctata]|uniref:uncharacterized protein LOC105458834 n=1 Tax=Wasmannia auropunctata TaxID=64793 RepID=UPI0005EE9FE3|nr:PREDICTED: uncharacterized protein LOC105458834 [Wasmannia auropunctata]
MIVATYNCGCPAKPSLIPESVGLQAPCSPCCFQSYGAPHRSQIQTAQCCTRSKITKKPEHIYPISKGEACCCINRKSFLHVPSSSARVPSARSDLGIEREREQAVSEEQKQIDLKNVEMSEAEQAPTDTVVSEIVRKEQPYKEIEAIINENRVTIRMHKESVKEEYDPPCECIGQVASKESASNQRRCDDGVTFDMAHGNLELCSTPREEYAPLSAKKTCEEAGCRTVTLYPSVKDDVRSAPTGYRMESREAKRSKVVKTIDLEENPNIFLLRIRKHCDSGDRRQTIDLEFRAPRPWKKKKDLKPKTLEEHEDTDKKYVDDIDQEHKDYTDKKYKDDEKHKDGIDEKIDAHKEKDE